MSHENLGLPLEYHELSYYFDAHNINENTQAQNQLIATILAKYDTKTVLDLTCGTGSQVFFLQKQGYKITGADLSPELIAIAQQRAHDQHLEIPFIQGDMRLLHVGTFDAVISMFNAVGHVTRDGFVQTMHNVHCNLKTGGIYLFDILNLQALSDDVLATFGMCYQKSVEETIMYHMQCSTLDRSSGLLTSYDRYMIQKNAERPSFYDNQFALQIYTADELKAMLETTSFEVIQMRGMDGSEFIPEKTVNMLIVARKKL